VVVTASVGVVNADLGDGNDDTTAETILRDADAAMYRAKESGRAGVVVFNDEMRKRAENRLDLEQELRLALDRGELWCAYQPIVSLVDGSVVGLEALARWTSPTRGLLSPASFIPIAEATGLIVPLGEQVLLEACRQVAQWQPLHRQLSVAVNVSARQFADDTLPTKVAAILAETRLDPGALHLEITETTMMVDVGAAIRQVARLHDLGVQLAIDDFGTGWSSLGQIAKMAPDCLKVDKSFVDGLGQDAEARTLVASIVGLARALGIQLVAEGVETELQLAELRALGAELAQGYLFSRPLPATELQAWLDGCGREIGCITPVSLLSLHALAELTPGPFNGSSGGRF
jgi:EAL domain-containing protein (putative c-di-GMP-specific phosphodiesterase class I)